MQYALLGDIHSSIKDLENVLTHISKNAPDVKLIGTGDLYECTISKKDITGYKFGQLEDVMLIPEGFTKLLKFPSVRGNQEERILHVTETDDPLRVEISALPEIITIGNAQIIHGHQWEWGGKPWALIHANVESSLTFFGHSHQSALTINGDVVLVKFGYPYLVDLENVLVNVGSVIYNKEWVHYNSMERTITFMKA